ncbi:MAG TPA: GlmL-related ornithine degradation protein [Clostridia bacterium]|nr:GlmL-related ornithine degradation protein [Clostridia bacterium]
MKVDALVAEIGSTTTIVNAFNGIDGGTPEFLEQGQSKTTVEDGDVVEGLKNAINDLEKKLKINSLEYNEMFATSSAAGGLRMSVHGLVYDMTVKAAREAALGAGANLKMITAGKMRKSDINKLKEIRPNIILIAGGVDYGERDTALYNASLISDLELGIPVIYAGNIENKEEIKAIFNEKSNSAMLYLTENVYPRIDELNVEPTRKIIQDVFEEHIIHAPGMEKIKTMVNSKIIPTPGAVMEASKILKGEIGDLIVIDVGGATTDIHSVTCGSDDINRILLSPEPEAKRTVEGDMGVYVNMDNILALIGEKRLEETFGEKIVQLISNYRFVPRSKEEIRLVEMMAEKAIAVALDRHSGNFRDVYGTSGKKKYAEGKDLTAVKFIIGTGGAITRLPKGREVIRKVLERETKEKLNPGRDVEILIDKKYIMASLGVLSKKYPDFTVEMLKKNFV